MSEMPIASADQVTPGWLTDVLRRNGHLPSGQVTALEKTEQRPFGSLTIWIKATYSDSIPAADLPSAFLLKIDGPGTLAGSREVEFYSRFATPGATAPWFDAVYDSDQRAYHLLLADLSATHYTVEREAPPTRAEAERMIDTLAALHAAWWDKADTGLVDQDLIENGIPDLAGWFDFMGERLAKDRRRIYEQICAELPALLRARLHGSTTLVHDDAHTWNFMQPRNPQHTQAVLIDWQQWGRSCPMHDVAYLIGLFWYPDYRQRQERAIIERYYQRLLEHGVHGYSRDDCWYDYRLYLMRNMLVPLWAWTWGHWAPHRWGQLEKALFAFHDLHCDDLLG